MRRRNSEFIRPWWNVALFLFAFYSLGFSQGQFVDRGEKVLGFAGGLAAGSNSFGFGAQVGLAYVPYFDIHGGYSLTNVSDSDDLFSSFLAGGTIYILRQSYEVPIGLYLTSSYIRIAESSESSYQTGGLFGAGIYKRFSASRNTEMMPQCEIAFSRVTEQPVLSFGYAWIFRTPHNYKYAVSPTYALSFGTHGTRMVGITVALLLGK